MISGFAPLSAQIQKGELKMDRTISAEITDNASHLYSIDLKKEQYVLLKLVQKGIDIKIETKDPDGGTLSEFDSPNGTWGPEYISIISTAKGTYTLEAQPFDESQVSGKYDLKILKLEPKAVTPDNQVDQLFAMWDQEDTPGVAVSIARDGKIIYSQGYGMANLEYAIPITPKTIFHIASVSKQFTAFAVLLLELDGKLDYDDEVRDYIPELPDLGTPITLKQLVHHTSGLRDQWNLLALAGWRLDDVITKEQILKLVSHQKELNFLPGEEYVYCNTGFTLLAEVVERVSGKSFAEFCRERMFEPLGMDHTLFYDDHQKIVENRAYSYFQDSTGYKKSVLSYANAGATSLFTTVDDLGLWAMNFEDPVVGNSDAMKKMRTRGILNSGDTISYAFGQVRGNYKGLTTWAHGGGDAGYRTYLLRFPDQRFSVSVFGNAASFNSGAPAYRIADIYLEEFLSDETAESEEEPEASVSEIRVDADSLSAYQGKFEIQPGFIIDVKLEDNELIAQATGQPDVKLIPRSTSEFKVEGVEAIVEFRRDDDGVVDRLKLYQSGQSVVAPRVKAFDTETVDLNEFTGRFYSEELSTFYDLLLKEEQLFAVHQRHSDIQLTPVKQDFFSGNIWFFSQVEFVRDDQGTITGCKVSSGRVRNVLFNKVE